MQRLEKQIINVQEKQHRIKQQMRVIHGGALRDDAEKLQKSKQYLKLAYIVADMKSYKGPENMQIEYSYVRNLIAMINVIIGSGFYVPGQQWSDQLSNMKQQYDLLQAYHKRMRDAVQASIPAVKNVFKEGLKFVQLIFEMRKQYTPIPLQQQTQQAINDLWVVVTELLN